METELLITKIVEETEDTKTYFLQPTDNGILSYKAGQFLTLLLEINGRKIRRSYSLGSTPKVDEMPFITIKRKINGEISRYIQDNFSVGNIIKTLPPAGRFIINYPVANSYFFIAGGSGIVPIFSIIKALLIFHPDSKVVLLNQSRSEKDIIYKKELEQLKDKFKMRFSWQQMFSKPITNKQSLKRLNNLLLEDILKEFFYLNPIQKQIVFYLCGPQAMMRMTEFTLKWMGFEAHQIKKEQFVVDLSKPAVPLVGKDSKEVLLQYENKNYRFPVQYPKSILEAALENNIALPYSCKAGICSTCLATVKKGKIIMSTNKVLTEKEVEAHKILTCVAYAATDVEISVGD